MINTDFPIPAIIKSDTISPPSYVETFRDDFETEHQNINNIIDLLITTFNLIGIDNTDEIIKNVKENPENFIDDDKPIIKKLSMAIIDYKNKIYNFENEKITSTNPLLKNYIDSQIKKVYEHIENKYQEKLNETQKELSNLKKAYNKHIFDTDTLRLEFNNLKYIYDSNTIINCPDTYSLLKNAILTDNYPTFKYLIDAFKVVLIAYDSKSIKALEISWDPTDEYSVYYTESLIRFACVGGNIDIFKYFIDSGIYIRYDDCIYVDIAVRWGRYDIVSILLENDAMVNQINTAPDTPEGIRIKKLLLKNRGNTQINLGYSCKDTEKRLKTSDKQIAYSLAGRNNIVWK